MAAGDQDKAMAGLLRRSLARDAGAADCPDANALATYYERSLDSKEMARYDLHLSQCPRCREQIALMVRAEENAQPLVHRNWLWDWRLLAAGVAALLVLTVWGVRRSAIIPGNSRTADQPLVAMSRPEQAPAPQPAPPSQDSLQAPPASIPQALVAPQALNRAASKAQSAAPAEPRNPQNEDRPLNERNYDNLLKLKPGAQTTDQPGSVTDEKKEEAKSAPAPARIMPAPMSSTEAPGVFGGAVRGIGGATAGTAANQPAVADSLRAKQTESVPRANSFGASRGVLGQLSEQRSASAIIQTPDPKVMWRIAGANAIERTEDGGASWRGQVVDLDAQLTAGAAPATKVCWLVGKGGMILVTKDITHWKKIPPPVPGDFTAVTAKNASSAVVTTANGQKFSTQDGGKKWIPADPR